MPRSYATQGELAGRSVEFGGAPHGIHTRGDGTEEWMTSFSDGEGKTLALMSRATAS